VGPVSRAHTPEDTDTQNSVELVNHSCVMQVHIHNLFHFLVLTHPFNCAGHTED